MRGGTFLNAGLMLVAVGAGAQGNSVRVSVRDDAGVAVPFTLVTMANGRAIIADDSGRVDFRARAQDSLRFTVRRIGYRRFDGFVRRSGVDSYLVTMPRIAATLGAVTVTGRAETPLTRTGFYDRVERVRKGAIVGEFLPPEELDARMSSSVSRILQGTQYARVAYTVPRGSRGRLPVIQGRGGCLMTVIVDGQAVSGTIQDDLNMTQIPTSISPAGTQQALGAGSSMTIDDVVDMTTVMAIEIYPSTANAPFELQKLAHRGGCGIVALWTGPRR